MAHSTPPMRAVMNWFTPNMVETVATCFSLSTPPKRGSSTNCSPPAITATLAAAPRRKPSQKNLSCLRRAQAHTTRAALPAATSTMSWGMSCMTGLGAMRKARMGLSTAMQSPLPRPTARAASSRMRFTSGPVMNWLTVLNCCTTTQSASSSAVRVRKRV